jgi:acetate kinase
VVHGGNEFKDSVRVDQRVKGAIDRLAVLAPLHNPPALAAIEATEEALPAVTQVAVFDTTFFAELPPRAYLYGVPYAWYEDWGIRRMGFHGINNTYCVGRAAELLQSPTAIPRLITCHLGGGCSATAVKNGKAIMTTMGFTPMEGLMMSTRSGSVDPGILTYVQRRYGLDVWSLEQALQFRSGLLGLSGISAAMSQVEEAANAGNERARLAIEIFADRVREAIGAMAVHLAGVDALVFTGRIGYSSAVVRALACEGLECLGVELDPEHNAHCEPDADIARTNSPARILVIRPNEELVIARETRRLVRMF